MIRKVLLLASAYMILVVISISFNSCDNYEATVCDVNFFAHSRDIDGDSLPELKFNLYGKWSGDPSCFNNQINIVKPASAFTKCVTFQNRILIETIEISCDQPMVFINDTFPAHTNLLAYNELASIIEIDERISCDEYEIEVLIDPELMGSPHFLPDSVTVTLKCSTDDGRNFIKSTPMQFLY